MHDFEVARTIVPTTQTNVRARSADFLSVPQGDTRQGFWQKH